MIVIVLAGLGSETKEATISFVNPRAIRLQATMMEPITMMGRLLPHFDVDSSATTPIIGCTIKPETGPATQTMDVCPLVSPRDRRYGVQSAHAWLARWPHGMGIKGAHTCHLNTPGEAAGKKSATAWFHAKARAHVRT